ncbi:MAG: 1-deoxy-D-xylulose-5-phosphate synthase [Akkermansia sp.]|nr:1-deoxy-D-xylulose-5-phosphate synthase [Akkermansia sp.]
MTPKMTMPNSPSSEQPRLLASIKSPQDVKALPADKLPELAAEIRSTLIHTLAETGGHLAPNLGLVELSIALHRVFNTPQDKILFDVSHQCYIHKLLTGRAEQIQTIRQHGGISGFCKRSESEHDAYGAGHAGTALSAGLGMAAARDLAREDYHVISVVGDGAFTCGTTLEGLNNIATTTRKFILILNDNEWSIDRNVGALSAYFASLQQTDTYAWLRRNTRAIIEKVAGEGARKQVSKLVRAAHGIITPLSFFQELGLSYYGPVDGHDTARLEKTLRIAARNEGPVIIHVITEKGRGYAPAASNPTKFHGIGQYNVEDGSTSKGGVISYSEAFGRHLTTLAAHDPDITAITAAMPTGTRLDIFRASFPKRYYDVGIAEEHAALFACGQATQGLKPYLAVYSTFMQRCVDMIQHDAALQKLPVRFCMDRAGLSPDDGPTHHGLFDIAMMRCIPGLVMMQPKDEAELGHMLATMNTIDDCPSLIRYPRGAGEGVEMPTELTPLPVGKAEVLASGSDVCLLALGNMNGYAAQVRELLAAQGISCAHVNARFVCPLDTDCIVQQAAATRLVVTMEDHVIAGGFGSAVMEQLNECGCATPMLRLGWPNQFIEHGTEAILRQKYGLIPQAMAEAILNRLGKAQ